MSRFVDRKVSKEWHNLLAAGGKNDGVARGQIELAIKWGVNLKILEEDNKKKQSKNGIFGLLGGKKEDSEPEDDEEMKEITEFDYDDDGDDETDDQKKERKEAEAEQAKLLDEIEIKSGDWQVCAVYVYMLYVMYRTGRAVHALGETFIPA